MLLLRSFVRRLLVQALISSTVMAGIQAAARFGPEFLPSGMRDTQAASSQAPGPKRPTKEQPAASAFLQDRTHADVKAGRFAVWRGREAPTLKIAPERLASKGAGNGLSDVMLFDRCRPGCESRDPLLAFNQRPAMVPPKSRVEAVDDDTAAVASTEVETVAADAPQGGSGVAAAARGGMSWARRVVGTAGSAIGW